MMKSSSEKILIRKQQTTKKLKNLMKILIKIIKQVLVKKVENLQKNN